MKPSNAGDLGSIPDGASKILRGAPKHHHNYRAHELWSLHATPGEKAVPRNEESARRNKESARRNEESAHCNEESMCRYQDLTSQN